MNSQKSLGLFRDLTLLSLILSYICVHRFGPVREYWREKKQSHKIFVLNDSPGGFTQGSRFSDGSLKLFEEAMAMKGPVRTLKLMAAAGSEDRSQWAGPALFEAAETFLYDLGKPLPAAKLYDRAARVLGDSPLGTSSLVAAALCKAWAGDTQGALEIIGKASTGIGGKNTIPDAIESIRKELLNPGAFAKDSRMKSQAHSVVGGTFPQAPAGVLLSPTVRLLAAGNETLRIKKMLASIAGSGGLEEFTVSRAFETCKAVSTTRSEVHAPNLEILQKGHTAVETCGRRVLMVAGSNNYHHASCWSCAASLSLGRNDTVLVNIDQHTDVRDDGRYGLDCGNWVGRAVQFTEVRGLVLIGQIVRESSQKDSGIWLGLSDRGTAMVNGLNSERYSFFPDNAPEMFLSGPSPPVFKTEWSKPDWNFPGLKPRGTRFKPITWRTALKNGDLGRAANTSTIYISVDLDVLATGLVVTDWGNGTMTLQELEAVVKTLATDKIVIGADVTGIKLTGHESHDEISISTMKAVCLMLLEVMGGEDGK